MISSLFNDQGVLVHFVLDTGDMSKKTRHWCETSSGNFRDMVFFNESALFED